MVFSSSLPLSHKSHATGPKAPRVLFVCADPASRPNPSPFVSSLVEGLREQGAQIEFGYQRFLESVDHFDVVHFQWPEAVFDWHKASITPSDVERVRNLIRHARSRGIVTCYTRHNTLAHYTDLPNVTALYRAVEAECDTIIHMSDYSRREYESIHGKRPVRHLVIPHHLYHHVDRSISQELARKRLGLKDTDKVLLAFGTYRAEEECELAVQAYEEAKKSIPDLKLLAPQLPKKYGFGEGTKVPWPDLPLYFAAADVVLIPRKITLNSGNLPMAYYFGKPVVGPAVGNVGEILEQTGNFTFKAFDQQSVGAEIVKAFHSTETMAIGPANRAFADANWDIARVSDLIVHKAYRRPVRLFLPDETDGFGKRLSASLVALLSHRDVAKTDNLRDADVLAPASVPSSALEALCPRNPTLLSRPLALWGSVSHRSVADKLKASSACSLKVFAVRGQLSANLLRDAESLSKEASPVLGDPVLLYPDAFGKWSFIEKEFDVAVVPHEDDKETALPLVVSLLERGIRAVLVDMQQSDPLEVVRQLAAARRVLASPLPAIVLADAMGIPNGRLAFPGAEQNEQHGQSALDFAFADYYSAFGQKSEKPLEALALSSMNLTELDALMHCMPREVILAKQQQLKESFMEMMDEADKSSALAAKCALKLAYSDVSNMGDQLNPLILKKCFGYDSIHTPISATEAELCGLGSFLGRFKGNPDAPEQFIWGTGFIGHEVQAQVDSSRNNLTLCAVRGALSKKKLEEALGRPFDIPLADPGLLAPMLLDNRPVPKKFDLGIIPHFREKDHPRFRELAKMSANSIVIDLANDPLLVIRQIASCKVIISSSLHGLIVADSFGIPNLQIKVSDNPLGDGFKFDDYYSSYGLPPQVCDLNKEPIPSIDEIIRRYAISRDAVLEKQQQLIDCFPYPPRELPPDFDLGNWFYKYQRKNFDRTVAELRQARASLAKAQKAQKRLSALEASASYRVGRLLTWPARQIRRGLKSWRNMLPRKR